MSNSNAPVKSLETFGVKWVRFNKIPKFLALKQTIAAPLGSPTVGVYKKGVFSGHPTPSVF